MNLNKPALVESTYQRDGKWYTLRNIDRSNQIEVAATAEEATAAIAAAGLSAKSAFADALSTPKKATTKKAKAKK